MSSWAAVAAKPTDTVKDDKHVDLFSGGRRIAVADATALIKGFSFECISEAVVTVQDILDEIRDKKARAWLQNLPCTVHTLEPAAESITKIVRFARLSGNLSALSVPDVKLLALTYELEAKLYGTGHLSLTPKKIVRRRDGAENQQTTLPGWGSVSNPDDWEAIDRLNQDELKTAETESILLPEPSVPEVGAPDLDSDVSSPDGDSSQPARAFLNDSEIAVRSKNDDDGWFQVQRKPKKRSKPRHFTDENSEQRAKQDGHESLVFCLTGDYAMQNVLLQMGLKLVTPDGQRVRQVAVYGSKCSSCLQVTMQSETTFCDNCGNASLYRMRLDVDENGIQIIGGLGKPRPQRGARHRIPPSKGGKQNKDAILSEDILQQAIKRLQNMKIKKTPDVLSPEFNNDTWYKTRVIKNKIKDQLPGRFGFPNESHKHVAPNRKR